MEWKAWLVATTPGGIVEGKADRCVYPACGNWRWCTNGILGHSDPLEVVRSSLKGAWVYRTEPDPLTRSPTKLQAMLAVQAGRFHPSLQDEPGARPPRKRSRR